MQVQQQKPKENKQKLGAHKSLGVCKSSSSGCGKLKRKDQHPVRKQFVKTGDTQNKCKHCEWTTTLNATRMVKHIVDHCSFAPALVREEIAAIQLATIEKERNSPFVAENKKDIHGLFRVVDNKRVCMFCQWSTVRNLTRMRNHIVSQCTEVPAKLLSSFIKKDDLIEGHETAAETEDSAEASQQDSTETYQVYTLDDRWDETGIEPMDYNSEDVDDSQLDGSYLEVQEIDGRSCSYCGKSLAYNSCEVETENEVYCSEHCLKRKTDQSSHLEKSKQSADEEEEGTAKKIKYMVVSKNVSPNTAKIKQEDNSTMVEIVDYTIEADDSLSAPDEPIASSKSLIRAVEKSPPKSVCTPKKSASKIIRPLEGVAHLASSSKQTAANDEGSCHSFAGGHVYPQEDVRSADHKLQWTKAVISRPAPHFEATAVVDGAFKKIKLSDYLGKYLVFFFYPLDFTFVCPTEILAFSDRVEEFQKLNAEVIAASIDSHFTHLAWINTPRKEGGLGKINIPLVSDITHSISKDYGVYLDDLGHTLRGLFIIDDRGILRQITMNDLPVGRSVDETLRLVQAFQYTDKHGEVCPAGWKPGQDTIVPNPEEKMKYFEKNHKY